MANIETLWTQSNTDRSSSLTRKRTHAEFTLPNILPREGKSQHQTLPVPYNSLPAEGINALAARLVSVVLPVNGMPIFELFIDERFNPEGQDTSQIDERLRRFERAVMDRLYLTNIIPHQHFIKQISLNPKP